MDMSEFVSTGVLLIAVWVVVIFIRSVFRNKSEHGDHVRRVEEAIELVKRAIDLEEKGATVDAQKDKDLLQRKIREAQAAPKKYQKQAQKEIECTRQDLENEKQERIRSFKRRLKEVEYGRDALRNNQANYRVVKIIADAAIIDASKQIGIELR